MTGFVADASVAFTWCFPDEINDQTELLLNQLREGSVAVVPVLEHRLTIYGAAYLELGQKTGFPFATLDAALRRAAQNQNVSLLGVYSLPLHPMLSKKHLVP